MVDVGGHELDLYCAGRGSPSVILDAGEGDTIYTWRKVQPALARFARVCSFDRAGMGFSGGGAMPLIVLTAANDVGDSPLPATKMRAADRARTAGHARLARLSSVGVNDTVPQCERYLRLDRPSVVTAAVAEVVSQAKHRTAGAGRRGRNTGARARVSTGGGSVR